MPTLIVKSGAAIGRRLSFRRDIQIGRSPVLDFCIDDPTISRRHAALAFRDGTCILSDLRSQNGTALNGRPVSEPSAVHHGDEIRVGEVLLELHWEDEPRPALRGTAQVLLSEKAPEVLQTVAVDSSATVILGDEADASTATVARRLELLYGVSVAISQTLDEEAMLSVILSKLFEVFPHAERGFIMVYEASRNELVPKASRTRSGEASKIAVSRTLVWDVIQNRRGVLNLDAVTDDRFKAEKSIRLLGIRSVVCVPMVAGEEVYGVITLDSSTSAHAFQKSDMTLLMAIAGQAALSLANARLHRKLVGQELMASDLALAKRIQARFLPKNVPDVEGYEFHAFYAAALEVGGDYYDFLELPGRRVGIALGDVSGKGVSAALYMVKMSSDVKACSVGESEPAAILQKANRALSRDVEEGMFATAIMMVLDPESGQLRVANAGHMPPLIRRHDGEVIALQSPRGKPLGASENTVYEQHVFSLRKGDTVVLFTDGVTEASDRNDRLFGEERLIEAMRASDGTPETVVRDVLSAVSAFRGESPQNDDITLLSFGPVSNRSPRAAPTKPLEAVRVDSIGLLNR